MSFRAEIWEALVLPDVKVSPHAQTVQLVAVYDPRFTTPWLLTCPLTLIPRALRGFYRDRWPISPVPLAAKHMLGAARQFVLARRCSCRWWSGRHLRGVPIGKCGVCCQQPA